ncbi:MAG TPA: TMEM175 family protein [Polyangiales bacterium]|nr:TMEM175 family protein [Polyangiales bacterium]
MTKNRLEAFSDGVIAILITIMVLELKVPHGEDMAALQPLLPRFWSYLLSFVYLGIYWNNHHHLLHACERVNGAMLWANMHLLFWLSLVPFATGWMGENHFAAVPTALYGLILILASVAFKLLVIVIVALHGPESRVARMLGADRKGWISTALYAVAIPLAFVNSLFAHAIYVLVALIWLVPDRRIEARFAE